MFNRNPDAKLINCASCNDIMEQDIKNGKELKNCVKCRELNNNKKKKNKNSEPQIKYESKPPKGFYNSDKFLYLDNVKEQNSTTTEEQETAEQETAEQETAEQDTAERDEQQETEQQEQPKEKTIKELLQDILNKLNNTPTTNNNNNKTMEDIEPILNNIYKQMDETHENVLLSHRARKEDHEQITEFIKQQELKNKIIINKLDNILKAIT